ncbi:MAG TPA: sulfur carrier protein ThiS [Bacteroidales bacterium]|nr:sulfur carrier protein ThiS [Bacteroidales bacterium]HPF03039.1 sulfur carrier protein ThiS [Bacteroidales bacterium]HPJ59849.1 sulfur carrier protein ThiS [Bacteroidales bacterium]HPR12703.1 sulfur carrier protein ThiS [Bacteroidales bacterium]HRW85573.1 sulfur carrier protein ThiS [Bacteroidales bacterium]
MKIMLNNREEEFDADTLSVREMLNLKKYSFRLRVIKINGELIPSGQYDTTFINDGDEVLMIYLMSGG